MHNADTLREHASQSKLHVLPDLAILRTFTQHGNGNLFDIGEAGKLFAEIVPPRLLDLAGYTVAQAICGGGDDY